MSTHLKNKYFFGHQIWQKCRSTFKLTLWPKMALQQPALAQIKAFDFIFIVPKLHCNRSLSFPLNCKWSRQFQILWFYRPYGFNRRYYRQFTMDQKLPKKLFPTFFSFYSLLLKVQIMYIGNERFYRRRVLTSTEMPAAYFLFF